MVNDWMAGLERRYLADLTLSEVARALRALSSNYVERRERLARRTAFDGAGKRAAYALYYSPLHLFTVAQIVNGLGLAARPARHIVDVGCGAGAAGAAWAAALTPTPRVTGLDEHPWAREEASRTYRAFGIDAQTKPGDAAHVRLSRDADAVVAAWVVNELDAAGRDRLLGTLVAAASAGVQVLIVEPISTRVSPWWREWADMLGASGARTDEWRFGVELPELVRRLGRAAGLRHDELRARSLYSGTGALLKRPAHGE